jgi:hypothetical protein
MIEDLWDQDFWNARAEAAKISPVGKVLVEAGFEPYHTGAGCTAWIKGDPDGIYVLVGDGDAGLGEHLDIETREWGATLSDDDRYADCDAHDLKAIMEWCDEALADPERYFEAQEENEAATSAQAVESEESSASPIHHDEIEP